MALATAGALGRAGSRQFFFVEKKPDDPKKIDPSQVCVVPQRLASATSAT